MQRRVNIQTYTAKFTTGDTGIATAGNSNAAGIGQESSAASRLPGNERTILRRHAVRRLEVPVS